jgi:hypothetical protein
MVMTDGELVKYAVDTSTEPQKLYDYDKFKENIPIHIGYIDDDRAVLF